MAFARNARRASDRLRNGLFAFIEFLIAYRRIIQRDAQIVRLIAKTAIAFPEAASGIEQKDTCRTRHGLFLSPQPSPHERGRAAAPMTVAATCCSSSFSPDRLCQN